MCVCGISDLISNVFVAYAVANYNETWAEKAKVRPAPNETNQDEEQKLS